MDLPGDVATYRLSAGEFASLGSGYGTDSALSTLRSAQLSKRMLLLHAVHAVASGGPGWHEARAGEAWSVLRDLTDRRPDATRQVLGHPLVDEWATRHAVPAREGTSPAGLSYLSGLAAAVAIRAGSDLRLAAVTPGGELFLPTLGLAYGLGAGPVTVRVRGGDLTVAGPDSTVTVPAPYGQDVPGWCASRVLAVESPAGPLAVTVEDLDPHRTCFGLPLAPRLDPAAAAALGESLDGAWQLLAADYPRHAAAIRECVRALVPLSRPASGSTSGSARTAFGAVAVSPADPGGLALLLIHETQHVKLGGLLDLVPMFDPSRGGLHHAPWRADPRPARALVQGIYAHAGVADFWRVRRTRTGDDQADFEFAYWLAQSRLAARQLAGSGELTPEGERFLYALTTTLDSWSAAPVDAALARGVDELVTAVAVRWRLDNHRPDPGAAARLATAWRGDGPCPPIPPPSVSPAADGGPARVEGLAAHVRARLTTGAATVPHPGDAAYLAGRLPEALAAYRSAVTAVPEDPKAWVGLALAVRAGGDADAARALVERPDLVRATLVELRGSGQRPAPEALAGWLATGLP